MTLYLYPSILVPTNPDNLGSAPLLAILSPLPRVIHVCIVVCISLCYCFLKALYGVITYPRRGGVGRRVWSAWSCILAFNSYTHDVLPRHMGTLRHVCSALRSLDKILCDVSSALLLYAELPRGVPMERI